jgi:hypothetical protein
MSRKQPTPERQNDRGEDGGAVPDLAPLNPGEPMSRFRSLTRRLLGVTREQLEAEQLRYDKERREARRNNTVPKS